MGRSRRAPRAGLLAFALGLAPWLGAGCSPAGPDDDTERPVRGGAFVRVLGTAQDGGLPHAACACEHCEAARLDPPRRRRIACLAIALPEARKLYLVDATPDLREQLVALRDFRPVPPGRTDRAPLDGIFLTHAHVGHYTGLVFLGFESLHVQRLPVYGSASMAEYLRSNGPWSQMVRLGEIQLVEIAPRRPVPLGQDVSVEPLAVPHRAEFTDTLAYWIRGPRSVVFYVPDSDRWEGWPAPLEEIVSKVDVAILDGTFFSGAELGDRDLTKVTHPFIRDTMARLEPLARERPGRVLFTHLNHTNPALAPLSPARREIEARGFRVLEEGQEFPL